MRRMTFACLCSLFLFSASFGGEWASSIGSCYEKGNKNISAGMCFGHIGYFFAFDYAFHDAISGGCATGFNGFRYSHAYRKNYMPIVVRAAFHPFNLKVIADKIRARNKLDVFVGLASGGRIGWLNYRGSDPDNKPSEPDVGGFFIREYIGIRFCPTVMCSTLVEAGSALRSLNIGVGIKF